MDNSFGLYLVSLRKKNYLTQDELADIIGVTRQAISNWERGVTLPDVQFVLPLAKILDTTAERILFMMCGEYTNKSIENYLACRKDKNNEKMDK